MPYTQTNREFAVFTELDDDKLLFQSLTGHEELGRLPEYELLMLSEDPDIALDDVLGTPFKIRINLAADQGEREINAFATRFGLTGMQGRFYTYSATLHPWLWFLTRTANCRIFQQKSVPDIIAEIFGEYSMADHDAAGLSANYDPREYCVQYRETDFDFVTRLMEEEGIYFYFAHADGRQTLKLADSYSAHEAIAGEANLTYLPADSGQNRQDAALYGWSLAGAVHTQTYALRDYNFETPRADLSVTSAVTRSHANAAFERYDYPGKYLTTAPGSAYARHRIEGLQAQHKRGSAGTRCRRSYAGTLFTLTDHPRSSENQEYLIVAASYRLDNGSYEAGGGGGADYSSEIVAMPASEPFRLLPLTAKPIVRGPQTAVVVGKAGEEIWTDQYGRIKVQFHWDREGANDENSSCWVRVAQSWAGKNWGVFFLPRMGHEVVVDFLEGDPDRPLVTGSVHNADNMPPYALPDNQTQSTIKSRSSKQGAADNFNEIRFEDKKDEEEIYVHAEKNMNRVVENNDTLKVGFEKCDAGDQTIDIYNDQSFTIGNDQTGKVEHDQKLDVGNDQTNDIGNDQKTTIGNTCLFEAQTSIELKVGSSSIKIEPAKITIKTTQLEIKADATAKIEAGATMDIKAGAPMTIQGAVVKIN